MSMLTGLIGVGSNVRLKISHTLDSHILEDLFGGDSLEILFEPNHQLLTQKLSSGKTKKQASSFRENCVFLFW